MMPARHQAGTESHRIPRGSGSIICGAANGAWAGAAPVAGGRAGGGGRERAAYGAAAQAAAQSALTHSLLSPVETKGEIEIALVSL